jgi:Co/Zn/Cd efflux system component
MNTSRNELSHITPESKRSLKRKLSVVYLLFICLFVSNFYFAWFSNSLSLLVSCANTLIILTNLFLSKIVIKTENSKTLSLRKKMFPLYASYGIIFFTTLFCIIQSFTLMSFQFPVHGVSICLCSFINILLSMFCFLLLKPFTYSLQNLVFHHTTNLFFYSFLINICLFFVGLSTWIVNTPQTDLIFCIVFAVFVLLRVFYSFKSSIYLSFHFGNQLPQYELIQEALLEIHDIIQIRHLYLWPLGPNQLNSTLVLVIKSKRDKDVLLSNLFTMMEERFGIKYCSIEFYFE